MRFFLPALSIPASLLIHGSEQSSSIKKNDPSVRLFWQWQLRPNVSQWVLNVRKGYRIQFASCLTLVQWCSNCCGTSGNRKDFSQSKTAVSPGKRGHRKCTLSREEGRFLQPVLYCAQKGWGAASILDVSRLNCKLQIYRFKMPTLKLIVSQIQSRFGL